MVLQTYKAGDKNSWISANTSFYDLVTLRPGKMSGYSSTARVANTGYLWQEVLTSSNVLSRQHCVLRKTLGHLHPYMQRQKSNFGKTAKDLQACFLGGRSRVVSRCLWWQKLDVSDETSGYTDSGSLAYSLSLRFGNKLYFSLQTSCFIKTGVETIRTYRSSDETRPAGSRHLMNQSIVISYIWWRRRRRTDLLFSLLLENSQYFISHSGKLTHSFFFSRTHILMPLIVAWLICRRKYKITARRTGHTKVDNTKYFRFKPLNLQ